MILDPQLPFPPRPTASVIIPWMVAEASMPWRESALMTVLRWWQRSHPDYELIVPRIGEPWRKGYAVARGLERARADLIIVADADVVCGGVSDAVDAVGSDKARWAIPHRMVLRMNQDTTALVHQGSPLPPPVQRVGILPYYLEVYEGRAGGGMVVLQRDTLTEIPMDPRFVGWGQEDLSWGRALTMLRGHPLRINEFMHHFWHEPPVRLSRGIGSEHGMRLWQRYQQAANAPMMWQLVDDARSVIADLLENDTDWSFMSFGGSNAQ